MGGRAAVAVGFAALTFVATSAAKRHVPALFSDCKHFNARYPHGVGRAGAHDKTKTGDPVTSFLPSTWLYDTAVKFNSDLDRDKDGIACEKR